MTATADELGGMRRREFRRFVSFSAAVHLGGLLVLALNPGARVTPSLPAVITVDLVAPAAPASSTRAAKPSRPTAAAVPVPVPKKTVLPKNPTLPTKPQRKARPKRRELTPEDLQRQAPAQDYEDVMEQLRAQAGEPAPAPAAPARREPEPVEVAAATGGGPGTLVDPEVASWTRRAKIHVRRAWVVPPGFRTQPLQTRVVVTLDAGGAVLGEPDVVRGSGNPWYDEGVVRAIRKASPLPAPPEAGDWEFVFVPEDSY